ncbi:MmpL efflux pump, putative [Hondaea fermentalgiana]|uniref:MmpL efflux pump, putative n=1 Tax=Hondaea fermentalgiana TaxID=2315210 RepID=A0A2R5GFR3_9STRA|nr:MmpL efflux pump, putative [Hondaea fermentalgiana]|eukprot:GBG26704.1 MmpL efflux pump, putative [Hondaea fermentalgiana]
METPLLEAEPPLGLPDDTVGERERRRLRLLNASELFERFLLGTKRWKRSLVALWILSAILGALAVPTFVALGTDNLQPPASSRAAQAQATFESRFQHAAQQIPLIVLVECRPNSPCRDVRAQELSTFFQSLKADILAYNETNNNVVDIVGWYGLNGTLLDGLKSSFVSASGKASFINLMVRTSNETRARQHFVDFVDAKVDLHHPNPDLYRIGVTGFDALNNENVNASSKQIARVDMVTIPLALLVLWYMVGSWRLLLLAIANMTVSILAGMALIVFIVKGLGAPQPEPTTTQLVEVITLALSVDYNLFLLGRFKTEIQQGTSVPMAVYVSMHRAGHVVFMSGVTIFLVMLGFVIIPTPTIRMDGIALSTGIACCIAVNLTMTPAMLYMFPAFFSRFGIDCRPGKNIAPDDAAHEHYVNMGVGEAPPIRGHETTAGTMLATASPRRSIPNSPRTPTSQADRERQARALEGVHPMYRGLRFKITRFVVQWPYNLIVMLALYALVVPLAVQILRIDLNQSILHLLPRESSSTSRLRRMYEDFPGGTFAPYYVLMTVPKGESVFRDDTFRLAQTLGRRIVSETACEASGVNSPALVGNMAISPFEAKGLLALATSPVCNVAWVERHFEWSCHHAAEYAYLWSAAVNPDRDAMLIDIVVPFFPFDSRSKTFIARMNTILDEELHRGAPSGVALALNGFEVIPNAIESEVLAIYPVLVSITLIAVFAALGFMLHSYFVPLRLVLTLFLPLASVFGLAVLVYQDGILDWTGLSSLSAQDGFFWSIPIMIVTMISGLALDYDVLLISAIIEHRAAGYDIQAAIVKATCETGATITAAGIIMFCAFGGLLLSDQSVTNQAGFLLSTSILVDTFVVNTILVPALISVGDKFAWRPMRMPFDSLVSLRANEFPQAS